PSPAAALVPHGATAPTIPLAVAPTPAPAVTPGPSSGGEPDAVAFVPVATYRAAVIVDLAPSEEASARETITALDGVVHVAAVTVTAAALGGVPADIAQVHPAEFRPFTPEATANSQPLWERIAAGDVAVTHEFGTTHEVGLGTQLEAGAAGPLRVGAFATNGTPPVADAIVRAGTPVGEGARRLLVALAAEASPTATVEALQEAGLVAEAIPDPRAPRDDIVIPAGGITPENVWDHLALCESSGDWQINTGNGYYGGVQFLPESWAMVGGTGLPHAHSREEQIHRAVLLWQIQGWEAWPQCARRLGLIVDPE
ncbi:MAG TPA: transglycosylase family protein, partial [Euzebya sp.]|nr:transglycosylase family protein [Euzebya sp.]